MSAQHHFAPGDQWDRDLYARERVLNSAIIAADISRGWEEYLEMFDGFYDDNVEVTVEPGDRSDKWQRAHSGASIQLPCPASCHG